MNDKLFRTLLKRYDAVIEDSLFKIDIINEQLLLLKLKISCLHCVNIMVKKRQIKLYCDINITQSVDTSSVDKVSTSVESVDNLAFV
jgi:hypothetical protein